MAPGEAVGLEIAVSQSGGARVLTLEGEFDLDGVAYFERVLARSRGDHDETVIIDPRRLTFMDSSALRAVLVAEQAARAEGGRFAVVRGSDAVDRVLALTGVAERLELIDDVPG